MLGSLAKVTFWSPILTVVIAPSAILAVVTLASVILAVVTALEARARVETEPVAKSISIMEPGVIAPLVAARTRAES